LDRHQRRSPPCSIFARVEAIGPERVSDEGFTLEIQPPRRASMGVAGRRDLDRASGVIAAERLLNAEIICSIRAPSRAMRRDADGVRNQVFAGVWVVSIPATAWSA
jgi:hypothetical protein